MNLPVAVVVVNHNTRSDLDRCLASLMQCHASGEIERIIVVDCASSDGSNSMVREKYPAVDLLDVPNRGYGAGSNMGVERSSSKYVFILNSDTILPENTVTTLFRQMEENHSVAIVGPRLRYPNGTIQPSRRRFPKPGTPVFESSIVQELFPTNPWTRDYYMVDRPESVVQEVDWVNGAALFVRRKAYESVGGFNENFWMFSEEVEWCYRLKQHGWKVLYIPLAEVIHVQGTSTSQDVLARQQQFDTSRIELHRILFGARNAGLVSVAIRLNYLAHLTRESMKWLVGHKRDLRVTRLKLYGSAFRASFRSATDPVE